MKALFSALMETSLACAQRPQFDAASIKPDPSPRVRSVLLPPTGGRLSTKMTSLLLLIENAYDIPSFRIIGGRDWIDTQGFDLEARAAGKPSRGLIMLMLQSLLEDRFALRVHRETMQLPTYRLTAAKGGLKLPAARGGDCGDYPCGEIMVGADFRCCLFARGRQIAMADFVSQLSKILGRTVIDRTGVTRKLDLTLEWSFDEMSPGMGNPPVADPPHRPSILDALSQQLGLKLTSSKGPVEVLVIDQAERPTAN